MAILACLINKINEMTKKKKRSFIVLSPHFSISFTLSNPWRHSGNIAFVGGEIIKKRGKKRKKKSMNINPKQLGLRDAKHDT